METLGTIDLIPKVIDARDMARASMRKARAGIHPVEERKQKKLEAEDEEAANAYTYAKLIDDFIARYHGRKHSRASTIREVRRLLARARPDLGDKPVRSITDGDIRKLRDRLAETPRSIPWRGDSDSPAKSEANAVLRNLKTVFKWAYREQIVDVDPTARVSVPFNARGERDRVLSDSELVAIWQACEQDGWPFGPITQLLILTGQRVREVSELSWSELDRDNALWHLPGQRAKNGKQHDLPLSEQALAVIAKLPRLDDVFAFPSIIRRAGKQQAVQNSYDFKVRLDRALPAMDQWVLQDLRRTVATGLQRLGVRLEVTEAVLNHVSGSRSGIVGIYQRHDWAADARAALDAWGRHVEGLVHPEAAQTNVVKLAGR